MSAATEHLVESKDALAEVFRNPSLRRLNLALGGSVIGDWAFGVAFSIYIFQRGGASALGIYGVVRFVTMAMLSPFAAVLADKIDRRRVMITADLLRAGLVTALAILVFADGPAFVVYGLSILVGYVGLAFRPAQAALLPHLARNPAELTAANVASSTINSVGFFIGPAIAGLMLAIADIGSVFMLNAITFVWSAVMVVGVRIVADPDSADAPDVDRAGETEEAGGMLAGVGDGFRIIVENRDLRLIMVLFTAQTIVAGCSLVYDVAIVFDLLGKDESAVGVVNAVLGIGGLVGAVIALVLAQRGKLARDFGLGIVLWAAPLLLVAAWPTMVSALCAMALIGIGNSVVDVNADTIMQRLVPDEVLGRAFGAIETSVIGGMAIGAGLMPILIATVGLRTGLVVIGVGVTALVLVSIPGLARIDRIALAPEGLDLLKGVPMLAVLPESIIERLARRSELVNVEAGTRVFREGDDGDRFFIIERGDAEVSIGGAPIRTLGASDSFGEIALIRDIPRTATVHATTDLVLRAIERHHFLQAVTGNGDAMEQAEMIAGRLMPSV